MRKKIYFENHTFFTNSNKKFFEYHFASWIGITCTEGNLIRFENITLSFAKILGETLNLVLYQIKGHKVGHISGPGGIWKFLNIYFFYTLRGLQIAPN